jgi:hypothetical protein
VEQTLHNIAIPHVVAGLDLSARFDKIGAPWDRTGLACDPPLDAHVNHAAHHSAQARSSRTTDQEGAAL